VEKKKKKKKKTQECNEDISAVLNADSVEAQQRAEQWASVKGLSWNSAHLNLICGDFNAPFCTFKESEWENGIVSSGRTEFDDNLGLYREAVDLICFEAAKQDQYQIRETRLFGLPENSTWRGYLKECLKEFGSDHVPVMAESERRKMRWKEF
jgi:hypothetical protein